MCLDAHAHGVRTEHEIFRSPNAVTPTLEDRHTPSEYSREGLASTLSMWRVQTEGYKAGTGQPIGVVSRDAGFFDSPDVEWISSGVNSKNSKAVALGRHGNFFHWGFAASPTYMTEEARLVFVNAVHYIAKFDGQVPVARKRSGTMLRVGIEQALDSMREEGYRETVAYYRKLAEEHRTRQDGLRAREEAGETLSDQDRWWLDADPPEPPGRFERVRRWIADADWPAIADDEQAIRGYFAERMPYFRPTGWYELEVDEELRSLGVGNGDRALLERAVEALGDAEHAAVARTLLERYTAVAFETQAGWRAWLEENRERLFFSEAAGYKWLVDDRSQPNRPAEPVALETSAREPLAAALRVRRSDSGQLELTVAFAVEAGWHAYLETGPGAAYRPIELDLELPDGLELAGEWTKPVGRPSRKEPGVIQLEGRFEYRCTLEGEAGSEPLVCEVRFQVCDENRCLRPTTERLEVELP